MTSTADQWGSYKEAESGHTHKKELFHTGSRLAVEEAASGEREPAYSEGESDGGCTGPEAGGRATSGICSNFRTLGF